LDRLSALILQPCHLSNLCLDRIQALLIFFNLAPSLRLLLTEPGQSFAYFLRPLLNILEATGCLLMLFEFRRQLRSRCLCLVKLCAKICRSVCLIPKQKCRCYPSQDCHYEKREREGTPDLITNVARHSSPLAQPRSGRFDWWYLKLNFTV
jgi:hypothetical protein